MSDLTRAWCDMARLRTTAMTYIAIAEALDGKIVDLMEKVSDEQYRA